MSSSSDSAPRSTWYGPLLVATGAFLWATDSLFRSRVIGGYSPLFIVFVNHVLCLIFALPALLTRRRALAALTKREGMALAFIATFGSVIAMLLFTEAFRTTANYTTPILIQKLQPLAAILLARLVLKERVGRRFPLWAALAVVGAYLVTFGWTAPWGALATSEAKPAALAAAAAMLWGATTVAGRDLLAKRDYVFVTAARFTFASLFIALLVLAFGDPAPLGTALSVDLMPFAMMALVSGLAPLVLYYFGLKTTPASTATLCELAFPLAAILLNWFLLNQPLAPAQLVGAVVLVVAITALSYENAATESVTARPA